MSAGIRWVLVAPTAIVGWVIAQIAAIVVTAFVPGNEVAQLVSSLVTPVGFIVLGARVAPVRKVQTAGILTVVLLFLHGAIWSAGMIRGLPRDTSSGFLALAALLGVIGSVLGLFLVYASESNAARSI